MAFVTPLTVFLVLQAKNQTHLMLSEEEEEEDTPVGLV